MGVMMIFPLSVTKFIREEEGATAVEYGILIAVIAAAIVVVIMMVGLQIESVFNRVCQVLANVTPGAC